MASTSGADTPRPHVRAIARIAALLAPHQEDFEGKQWLEMRVNARQTLGWHIAWTHDRDKDAAPLLGVLRGCLACATVDRCVFGVFRSVSR